MKCCSIPTWNQSILPLPLPMEVLLVEDDLGDAMLVQEGFKRSSCPVNVSHVMHAEECLRFLEKAAPYTHAPTPDLLLVDLILPAISGRELIEALLADKRFRHLPIVVLTNIADEHYVRAMYDLGCSSYIVKPLNFVELQQMIETIYQYWGLIVKLPRPAR